MIILATLWPAYARTLRADDPADDNVDGPRARYPDAVDILTDRRVHEIRLDTFSASERAAAARLSASDPRLAAAVADRDYNVSEALAGARELIGRYQRATATQRAVLHAAVDARRLGIQDPLTEQLLCAAARGYLTGVHPDDAWFPPALHELASRNRPQDKATAPLIPIGSPDRRTTLAYTVADYLLQHLTQQRRTRPVPTLTWQAFGEHTHNHDDLARLADHATRRLFYTQAITICQRLADAGDKDAARPLADLLAEQGRVDELRLRADTGDGYAAWRLANLLARQGRIDEAIEVLQGPTDAEGYVSPWRLANLLARHGRVDEAVTVLDASAGTGDNNTTAYLADLLARQGRVDELRLRADAGDRYAAWRLAEVLAHQGRIDELHLRADAGDGHAARRVADVLTGQGQVNEAVVVLRASTDTGDGYSARRLASVLAEQGRVDELRLRAETGDECAIAHLADLLAQQDHGGDLKARADTADGYTAALLAGRLAQVGRVDEAIAVLRARADAGDRYAAAHLADLLAQLDRVGELRARADTGDEYVAAHLVDLLARYRRLDDLRAEVHAGTYGAADRLLRMLTRQGDDELAERIRQCGLGPEDAGVAPL